jgi:hypothetical protein
VQPGHRLLSATAYWKGPALTYVRYCFVVRTAATSSREAVTQPTPRSYTHSPASNQLWPPNVRRRATGGCRTSEPDGDDERRGFVINPEHVYVDNGRSARESEAEAAGLGPVAEGGRNGSFQHVFTHHPDRLMRQLRDLEELLQV